MNAYIAGVGMTRFGKHLDSTLKGLAGEAICEAIEDAGIERSDVEAAYMANAAGGVVQGQEMISGQVALRYVDNAIQATERYPANPNGSAAGITGCGPIVLMTLTRF